MEDKMKNYQKLIITTAVSTLMFNIAFADKTVNILIDNTPRSIALMDAVTEAYHKLHPDINFDIEQRPGGAEGDNIVKTRLATGEMADVFIYNSGSLFQAIKPERTVADVSDIAAQSNILESYKQVVTTDDGKIRGVPFGPAMAGGIFYNKKIYNELGLEVPLTWADFMANNEKIKAAGYVPVVQTYRDTWTSQLFVLADFYNVLAIVPNFATDFTANKVKFSTTPVALRGFEHLEEVYNAGYLNADFGAATFDDGMRMVATGKGAHYPMLTFGIDTVTQNYPENINDLGFFAQPGDDAAKNGLTTWMSDGIYISKDTSEMDTAIDFINFVGSPEGCQAMVDAGITTGPYLIKGCKLPDDVYPAVADMLPYFEVDGKTAPALEFLSPVKGPALEQITVEVGSGIRPALSGAELYDNDIEKQAKQLRLKGW